MSRAVATVPEPVRQRLRVRGQVQGVGFRPFVYRLATDLGLSGWVRNDAAGVEIEVQGGSERLADFQARLTAEAPPLARIETVERQPRPPRREERDFLIAASRGGAVVTGITPDAAVCEACLAELFEPADRRYRYPFINCTHCGPRYTITAALPYDRAHTSMARFTMCPPCASEYHGAADRRFHAQPDACPACGPRLDLCDADGRRLGRDDAVAAAVERLQHGEILALKGLGGFHLVCDARNAEAVRSLRGRKQREAKPLAVMLANPASLASMAFAEAGEVELLTSKERPIVLLRKHPACDRTLPGVAPDMGYLGVMLPYTPLHYLLFHEAAGRPRGTRWLRQPQPLALVCTSANPNGEPLVIGNDEAFERLRGIADAYLVHDRDIVVRCDDSVVSVVAESPGRFAAAPFVKGVKNSPGSLRSPSPLSRGALSSPLDKGGAGGIFIRRARGYTPQPIKLARGGPAVLACGGHLKNTVCLTRGDEALLSQHIGDLDNAAACTVVEETVEHLLRVLEISPAVVAHDLHPDFFSSRFAARFAERRGIACVPVQHHHAHIAAVLAEHRLDAPALGVALDGVGLGDDGGLWGGELLHVHGARCERLGHLQPLALPGGDRAAREPWRMAASALHALGRGAEIESRYPERGRTLRGMLDRGCNAPPTASAGRLFDAAAGLLGVAEVSDFEGQAAMRLEALAAWHGAVPAWSRGWRIHADGRLDLLALLDRLAGEGDAAQGAALFHATLAQALAQWVVAAARRHGTRIAALGGGCFLNRILGASLRRHLHDAGLTVLEARQAPPNDGGLSLGQAWVALNAFAEKN